MSHDSYSAGVSDESIPKSPSHIILQILLQITFGFLTQDMAHSNHFASVEEIQQNARACLSELPFAAVSDIPPKLYMCLVSHPSTFSLI
jgi:hypothetical protein